MILYMENPKESTLKLLEVIEQFSTVRVQHREAKARDPGGSHVWPVLEGWKPPGRRGEGAPSRVRGAGPLARPALHGHPAPSPRSWSRIGLGGAQGPGPPQAPLNSRRARELEGLPLLWVGTELGP